MIFTSSPCHKLSHFLRPPSPIGAWHTLWTAPKMQWAAADETVTGQTGPQRDFGTGTVWDWTVYDVLIRVSHPSYRMSRRWSGKNVTIGVPEQNSRFLDCSHVIQSIPSFSLIRTINSRSRSFELSRSRSLGLYTVYALVLAHSDSLVLVRSDYTVYTLVLAHSNY